MKQPPAKQQRTARAATKEAPMPWRWADSMCHGVLAVDRHGTIVAANRSAQTFFGWRTRPKRAVSWETLGQLLDGETRAEIKLPAPRDFTRGKANLFIYKAVCLAPGGAERIVNVAFTPLSDAKGTKDGVLMVFQDVSDNAARECLLQNRKEMEVLGVMARNIAGDFGHWIGVISGHAARIAESLLPNTRAHEDALGILAASENANDTVKRLMDMTAATDPRHAVRIETVCLGDIVGNAITLARDLRPGADISFHIRNLKMMMYSVTTDPALLLDCLTHIFNASAETMPRGGKITLGATRTRGKKNPRVVLRILNQSDGRHLPHSDTVAAIQADAENWNGEIQVQKQPGKGLAYVLRIPCPETEAEDKPATAQPLPESSTVLVADDDENALEEMRAALHKESYAVHTARNGKECLALYRKFSREIRLCILDFLMPDTDARELLREILAHDPTVSIIVVSGFSRDFVRGQIEHSAWSFAQKPLDIPAFLDLVKQTLTRKAQHETASRKRLLRESDRPARTAG